MVSPGTQEQNLYPGSYVIIEPDMQPIHGNFVLATAGNKKEPILRQYIEEGGVTYLKPLNSQYPLVQFSKNMEILGVVVANVKVL